MSNFIKTAVAAASILAGSATYGLTNDTKEAAKLRALTQEWVDGWHTSPEKPFSIDQIANLYVQDERLFSYDFGRPHNGVSGWKKASAYYEGFMAIPAEWKLEASDDMRVSINGDVAWSTVSLSASGEMPSGEALSFPESRVTLIFERQDNDTWRIIHEHGSSALPFPDLATTSKLLDEERSQ